MKITSHFLNWLDRKGRKRIVMDRQSDDPYLERYYLFLKDRESFPFNVFLHKFLKGDPDDVHDHPWPYATLILRGGYYEYTPIMEYGRMTGETKHWRGPGHFRICKPNSYHRIELKEGVTAWTLFMPGPKKRDWGFLVKNRWVQHEQYLKEKYEQAHNNIH
jgi:hypothetical protein